MGDDIMGCKPDYLNLGMQAGEEVATALRLAALCLSISVLFPWLCPIRRSRMRIFFLHWASGVMYVLSQFIMSVMVLNCWSSRRYSGPVVFILKFWELASLNLWSISSLAIAILIASIVQSFAQCRRVPLMIGSPKAAYICVAASVVATTLSAAFWNSLVVTGGYFWVTNTHHRNRARWISLSFGATQTVAGILMAFAVLFSLTGSRLSSLRVCCKSSKRVYFHFILTIFGTCVYVYNGIVLMIDEFSDSKISTRLVIIGWCSRYVHVIADTAIIFGAFKVLEKSDCVEDAPPSDAGQSGSGGPTRVGGSTFANTTSVGHPTVTTPLPRPAGVSGSSRYGECTPGKFLARNGMADHVRNKGGGNPTKNRQQQLAPSAGLPPKAGRGGGGDIDMDVTESSNASSNMSSTASSANGQREGGRRPRAKE